ncbi:hypothetical protein [Aurantiacibacter rhizosphaerae]|uniref:Uncharacterized protein n=1 Tax=Aurantiacibacter rhizosphaerae TaxID=2691582 RepID=A0A844XB83_9SPHN|nr:hypothetical protein [Aurantiacibacter rhizosphaerae]MWV27751.1 hypothetical protein [Aurantiacibacter rhizosphaerae]
MYVGRAAVLLALVAGIGACSGESSENDSEIATLVPEDQATSPIAAGTIGPVAYSYDTSVLTRAEIRLPLPPTFEETEFAVKFLPVDLVDKLGERDCSYTRPDGDAKCTAEQEVGFALAFLERPVEHYGEALIDNLTEDMRIEAVEMAGRSGFALDTTRNGSKLRYTFLPVESRTLLMMERNQGTVSNAAEALKDVRESLRFPED